MPSCCVVGCASHSSTTKDVKFHRFPVKRIKLWAKVIHRRDWIPSFSSRICSRHFVSGYPGWDTSDVDWVPTLNMRPTTFNKITSHRDADTSMVDLFEDEVINSECSRQVRLHKRNLVKETQMQQVKNERHEADSLGASLKFHNYIEIGISRPVTGVINEKTFQSVSTQTITDPLLTENENLKKEIIDLQETIKHKTFSVDKIRDNDVATRFYTGLPTFAVFMWLFNFVEEKASRMKYYRASTVDEVERRKSGSGKLSLINQFLAVLMRLKLGLFVQDISERFDISCATFSGIFTTWICFLEKELASLCPFPNRELVEKYMPEKFRKYPNTRIILDCTEVFIERSSDMLTQNITFSSYKHHNTAKFLVGITPGGVISLISPGWGGRASDKLIVDKSGVINMLDYGDNVMADKGFKIDDLIELKGCTLNIPPFLKNKQFTEAEVLETRRIAELRIHVERAIGRIKCFHILDGVFPITQIKLISSIFAVCGYLTNINKPLL